MAVGSVSEPEYVHRRTADQPGLSGGPERGPPRPRLGKEAVPADEDVVYGQVFSFFRTTTINSLFLFDRQ